jgi:trk system potassium uptake protein TrkH
VDDRRYVAFLRERYRTILGYLGDSCLLAGLVIASPLVAFPLHSHETDAALGLLVGALAGAVPGVLLRGLSGTGRREALGFQEGSVLVVLCWGAAALLGAVPFLFVDGFTLPQAVFESTSGWTTTGLSVADVLALPRLLLLYRSVIQLAGGIGFALMVLSSLGGPTGTGLGSAEGRTDLLVPNMKRSSRLVLLLYGGYAACGILGLRAAGMGWFDAVNHSFAAVSTGGFGTYPDSLGHWDSVRVEAVCIALMILGNLNFLTAWTLFRGRFAAFSRNGEVRLQALLLVVGAGVVLAGTTAGLYATLGKSARVAVFETCSALTTTGFSTVGYGDWNGTGWTVMILLMIVGGGTGSTAGGLKQYRVHALGAGLLAEVRRMFLPPGAIVRAEVQVGDRRRALSDADLRGLGTFLFLYVLVLAAGTLALSAWGVPLRESLFEFSSALGTVGLSSGVAGPATSPGPLWVLTAGMFLGRLEMLIVILFAVKVVQHAGAILRP